MRGSTQPLASEAEILLQQRAHPLGLLSAAPIRLGMPFGVASPLPSSVSSFSSSSLPVYGSDAPPPLGDDAPPPYASADYGSAADFFSEMVCIHVSSQIYMCVGM